MIPESLARFSGNVYLDSPRGPGFVLSYRRLASSFALGDFGERCRQMEEEVRRGVPEPGWAKSSSEKYLFLSAFPPPSVPFPAMSLVVLVSPALPPSR